MTKQSLLIISGFIISFLAISFGIGQVTQANMGWYDTLVKSPLNPPRFVFPLMWTSLYVMLALVGARLWMGRHNVNGRKYLNLFSLYMLVNWLWSFIFFGGHFVDIGFAWIILSDVILACLVVLLFQNKKSIDAWLLVPTLLWGCFAAYLNGYISVMM